ncbi:MAG: Vms1/Ankzf1 family peptidyl-tRNA hydrolase [Microthrixaceae bacterium]|nr:Vms1/Ankzf1 family peptidyl-tRNA hydrolase [Microthrixaceae bacterium]
MTALNELVTCNGPVATVVMSAPSAIVNAAERFETHWQRAYRELTASDLDPSDLRRLDETASGLHHGEGSSVVLIGCPGADAFVEFLDEEVGNDLVVVDTLPRLGALLESRQRSVPHVIVVADRAGADIVAIDGGSVVTTLGVEGETEFIHRGHPGGFSQRRYQQRAENLWESNAAQTAEVVAKVARDIRARLVAVAGDVRAVGFLREHLPTDVAALTHELDGQSDDLIATETRHATADVVARDTRKVMRAHRDACGTGRGADGAPQTTDALSIGRVATLLVHDDPADDRRGLVDLGGTWCSSRVSDAAEPRPGRRWQRPAWSTSWSAPRCAVTPRYVSSPATVDPQRASARSCVGEGPEATPSRRHRAASRFAGRTCTRVTRTRTGRPRRHRRVRRSRTDDDAGRADRR